MQFLDESIKKFGYSPHVVNGRFRVIPGVLNRCPLRTNDGEHLDVCYQVWDICKTKVKWGLCENKYIWPANINSSLTLIEMFESVVEYSFNCLEAEGKTKGY